MCFFMVRGFKNSFLTELLESKFSDCAALLLKILHIKFSKYEPTNMIVNFSRHRKIQHLGCKCNEK